MHGHNHHHHGHHHPPGHHHHHHHGHHHHGHHHPPPCEPHHHHHHHPPPPVHHHHHHPPAPAPVVHIHTAPVLAVAAAAAAGAGAAIAYNHHHNNVPHFDHNRTYHIKSASPDAHPGCNLTVHVHYDSDKRNEKSDYVAVHQPGWKGCSWVIERFDDGTFSISMGKDTDYKHTVGRRLAVHGTLHKDHIDHEHSRALLHDAGFGGDRWHIKKTDHNTYVITCAEGNYKGWHLSAKYPHNARGGGKSAYVCAVRPGHHPEPHWHIE